MVSYVLIIRKTEEQRTDITKGKSTSINLNGNMIVTAATERKTIRISGSIERMKKKKQRLAHKTCKKRQIDV